MFDDIEYSIFDGDQDDLGDIGVFDDDLDRPESDT
jgi:hypothetical protein